VAKKSSGSDPDDWAYIGNKREADPNPDGIYSGGVSKRHRMTDGGAYGEESREAIEPSPKRTSLRKPHE
jgi:hypothetical protein